MPELVYNVKFQIDSNISQDLGGVSTVSDNVADLKRQLQEARKEIERLNGSSGSTVVQTDRMNRSFSSANQALFSFSDLTQDATQFSYGFSSGMRAIGNNIGFTAELLANLSTKIDEYNEFNAEAIASGEKQAKTVGTELRGAFSGAAGAIILLNVAVTAFTMLSRRAEQRVKEIREESAAFVKVLSEVNSEFAGLQSDIPDPFGFRQRDAELKLLRNSFGNVSQTIEKDFVAQIGAAATATGNLGGALLSVLNAFDFTRDMAISIADTLKLTNKEVLVQVLAFEELSKEVEKQRLTQEAFERFINQKGNETLKDYIDLTAQLASVVAIEANNAILLERNSLIRLNNDMNNSVFLREELGDLVDRQASTVQNLILTKGIENEETVKEISLLNQLVQLYDKLTNSVESARDEIEKITNAGMSSRNQFSAIDITLSDQLLRLEELRARYPELSSEIDKAANSAKEYADRQKMAVGADAIAGIAQAAGQFSQLFGASKEFRIAMATIDAIAAVISTFATVPFPANIATAAGIAASLAAQIKSMESTDIGTGGSSKVSGTASGGFGFNMTDVQGTQTFRTPTFSPSGADGRMSPKVDVKIMADRKQLYAIVKQGEEEYRQIKV